LATVLVARTSPVKLIVLIDVPSDAKIFTPSVAIPPLVLKLLEPTTTVDVDFVYAAILLPVPIDKAS